MVLGVNVPSFNLIGFLDQKEQLLPGQVWNVMKNTYLWNMIKTYKLIDRK